MKKRDNERRYKHLAEKDYLKAIMTDLSLRFDFNNNSWICETLVNKFDETIDLWEKSENISRIKPGELLLPFKNKLITIPLLDKKAIEILIDTKIFTPYRKRIINNTLGLLRSIDKHASLNDVNSLIYQRDVVPRFEKGTDLDNLDIDPSYSLVNPDDIGINLTRIVPSNISLPTEIKDQLISFCMNEIGLKPFIARNILDYFIDKRAQYLPLKKSLKPGQMVWIGTSFKKAKKIGCVQIKRQQLPIILTLYTEDELKTKANNLTQLNNIMMKQLARITTEAYLQEALLPVDELQIFYLRSYSVIGKLLRKYMKNNKVILPTPGSIIDSGTMFTHKELVIDLSMQGYYTKEIGKKTYHDPRSVDAYLKAFNSILVLWYYNLPKELISMVTERGQKVVQQHIDIITKYFPDNDSIKMYLNNKGIAVC